jgi:hypothetical protein
LIGIRGAALLAEQRKQQREDDTNKDGRSNGKVKSELFLFDQDIAGQSADPWDLLPDEQENTDKDYENPQKDKHLSQRTCSEHRDYP